LIQDHITHLTSHVLDSLPVKPENANDYPEPLGFLTTDCRTGKQPNTNRFMDEQIKLSQKIIPTNKDHITPIFQKIKDSIEDADFINRYNMPMPYIIKALSGRGKSILMAQLVGELISIQNGLNHSLGGQFGSLKFDRILYSQLRNAEAKNSDQLLQSVLQGLDNFHKSNSIHQLKLLLDKHIVPSKQIDPLRPSRIIFIDSLDENDHPEQYADVSKTFGTLGFIVVWACRKSIWEKGNFSEKFTRDLRSEDKNKFNEFCEDVEFGLNLKVGVEREEILRNFFEEYFQNKRMELDENFIPAFEEHAKMYYLYLYSHNEVLHMFYANTSLVEEIRCEIDQLLFNDCLDKFIHYWQTTKNQKLNMEDFLNNESAIKNQSNLFELASKNFITKTIFDTCISFISKYEGKSIQEHWIKIRRIFIQFQKSSLEKKKDLSDFFEIDSSTSLEDEILEAFCSLGMLMKLNGVGFEKTTYRFRHRDFSAQAFIDDYMGKHIEDLPVEDSDLITRRVFYPFFPELCAKYTDYIPEFLRRSGNILLYTFISAFDSFDKIQGIKEQTFLHESLYIGKRLPSTGVTKNQYLHVKEYWPNTIILDGYPGTGKTFTGIELILERRLRMYKKGLMSRPLIICLNDRLAKHIKQETLPQHLEKGAMKKFRFTQDENHHLLKSIDVLSLKMLLKEWAPDFREIEMIDESVVQKIFEPEENKKSRRQLLESDYRAALEDYQQILFDPLNGQLISIEEYKEKKAKLRLEVREEFFKLLKQKLRRGRTTTELTILLRNRFLYFEHLLSSVPDDNFNREKFPMFLDSIENIKEQDLLNHIRTLKSEGRYDIILIDEIQDLNPQFVVLLSFLNPERINQEKYRFIISGDDLQTLNGMKFDWKDFFSSLKFISESIFKEVQKWDGHIYRDEHHLFSLMELESKNKLHEVYRNGRDVFEYFTTAAGLDDLTPLKDEVDRQCVFIEIADNEKEYLNKLEQIIELASKSADVSLVVTNQSLLRFIKNKMEGKNESNWKQMETFDIWNIKGLERKNVILIGSYLINKSDIESAELFNLQNKRSLPPEEQESHERALEHYKSMMLVAQSRAEEQMFILHLKESSKLKLNVRAKNYPKEEFRQLEYPKLEKFYTGDFKTDLTTSFLGKIASNQIFSMIFKEALELSMSAREHSGHEELSIQAKNRFRDNFGQYKDSKLCTLFEHVLQLGNLTQDSPLFEDLLRISGDFHFMHPPNLEIENDKYSKLLTYQHTFQSKGPWCQEGYSSLESLTSNIADTIYKIEKQFPIYKQIKTSLDKAENYILLRLKDLFESYAKHLNIPPSIQSREVFLMDLLLSEEKISWNNSKPEEISSQIDEDQFRKILESLKFSKDNHQLKFAASNIKLTDWTYEFIYLLFCHQGSNENVLPYIKSMQSDYDRFVKECIDQFSSISPSRSQLSFLLLRNASEKVYMDCEKPILDFFCNGCSFDEVNKGDISLREKFIDNVIKHLGQTVAELDKEIVLNFDNELFLKCYKNLDKLKDKGKKYSKLKNDLILGYNGYEESIKLALEQVEINFDFISSTQRISSFWIKLSEKVKEKIQYEENKEFYKDLLHPTDVSAYDIQKLGSIAFLTDVLEFKTPWASTFKFNLEPRTSDIEEQVLQSIEKEFSRLSTNFGPRNLNQENLQTKLRSIHSITILKSVALLNRILIRSRKKVLTQEDSLFEKYPFIFSQCGVRHFEKNPHVSNHFVYESIFNPEETSKHLLSYFMFNSEYVKDDAFSVSFDGFLEPTTNGQWDFIQDILHPVPEVDEGSFVLEVQQDGEEPETMYFSSENKFSHHENEEYLSYKDRLDAYVTLIDDLQFYIKENVDGRKSVHARAFIEDFIDKYLKNVTNQNTFALGNEPEYQSKKHYRTKYFLHPLNQRTIIGQKNEILKKEIEMDEKVVEALKKSKPVRTFLDKPYLITDESIIVRILQNFSEVKAKLGNWKKRELVESLKLAKQRYNAISLNLLYGSK
jgi:hypothetical protein